MSRKVSLRPLNESDNQLIAQYGNDIDLVRNLRDSFPHPYTIDDANFFLKLVAEKSPLQNFAIDVDGAFAGIIGIHPFDDIYRCTAEIGYWLGKPYRHQGIMRRAIPLIVQYGWDEMKLHRIQAAVFGSNPASMRVLEHSGFIKEAVLKERLFKNGALNDEHIYVVFNPNTVKNLVS